METCKANKSSQSTNKRVEKMGENKKELIDAINRLSEEVNQLTCEISKFNTPSTNVRDLLEEEEERTLEEIIALSRKLQAAKLITAAEIQKHMLEQYENENGLPVKKASELDDVQRIMLFEWMKQKDK